MLQLLVRRFEIFWPRRRRGSSVESLTWSRSGAAGGEGGSSGACTPPPGRRRRPGRWWPTPQWPRSPPSPWWPRRPPRLRAATPGGASGGQSESPDSSDPGYGRELICRRGGGGEESLPSDWLLDNPTRQVELSEVVFPFSITVKHRRRRAQIAVLRSERCDTCGLNAKLTFIRATQAPKRPIVSVVVSVVAVVALYTSHLSIFLKRTYSSSCVLYGCAAESRVIRQACKYFTNIKCSTS